MIDVDEVYICELCQRAYEPEEINGVRKLKEFSRLLRLANCGIA